MLKALIGKQVLHALGEPRNLLKVQVRPLWDGYYRVNVLVGEDVTSARVTDSFFVTIDGEGKILTSSPKVVRRY